MTPYESITNVTTTANNKIVAIPFPGRCSLSRIAVVRVGTGSIAVDLYNRAFTSAAINIRNITQSLGNFCLVTLYTPLALGINDAVTIGSNGVSGYNTTHHITSKIDDTHYITDVAYTTDGVGGTLTLAIPSAERILYHVMPQLTGTDALENMPNPGIVYFNQDPLPNLNIGVNRVIYAAIATAGTYRIAIRAYENVGY